MTLKEPVAPFLGTVLVVLMGCTSHSVTLGRPRAADPDCTEQVRASGGHAVDRHCLRLGAVTLGMSHAEVLGKLGPADLELSEPASCSNAVYVLNRSILASNAAEVRENKVSVSTLRVIYRGGHVAAIEANGVAARQAFGFGPVRIGDSTEAVQRALGVPNLLSGQVWNYQSLLLLVDDDEAKVEAIAVTKEDAFDCLLPAAFELSCDSATGAPRGVTIVRPPSGEVRLHGQGQWPGTIMRLTSACSGRRSAPPLNR